MWCMSSSSARGRAWATSARRARSSTPTSRRITTSRRPPTWRCSSSASPSSWWKFRWWRWSTTKRRNSVGEWTRPQLEAHDFGPRAFAALQVEGSARRDGRPEAAALPAFLRIVDAAVEPLRVVAERIRHAQHDEFAVDQREQAFVHVAGGDRHVGSEPESVELVDPGVVARLDASRVGEVAELGPGEGIERPAFRAMLAERLRAVERRLAFAPIEAREVPARERGPV